MNKGFSPVVANAKLKSQKTQPQPISMPELEGGLLNYFDDVPDARVDRTKLHLLKDIKRDCFVVYNSWRERMGRHGKLRNK